MNTGDVNIRNLDFCTQFTIWIWLAHVGSTCSMPYPAGRGGAASKACSGIGSIFPWFQPPGKHTERPVKWIHPKKWTSVGYIIYQYLIFRKNAQQNRNESFKLSQFLGYLSFTHRNHSKFEFLFGTIHIGYVWLDMKTYQNQPHPAPVQQAHCRQAQRSAVAALAWSRHSAEGIPTWHNHDLFKRIQARIHMKH